MTPLLRNRIALMLVLVVAVVGVLESVANRTWDLAVVFGLAVILQLMILASVRWRRPTIALRRDLVEWLEDRAVATGEPVEAIADRCVATYRAALTDADEDR